MLIIWVCIVCVCVCVWNILMFIFSINSPELLELAAVDVIVSIAATHHIVTQHFECPWPVLIVSRAASSLGTRSFYDSAGSHE
jgi:hypothetical protein